MADETQIDSGADKPAAKKVSRKKVATTKAATKKATTKKATTKKATAKKATRKKATRKKAKAAEPLVEADMSRPVRQYVSSDSYAIGDRIEHASLGPGVVDLVRGPSKIQVFFSDGHRVLVHQRALPGA